MVLPLLALLPAAGHAIGGFAVSHGLVHGAVGMTAQAAHHLGWQVATNAVQGAAANPSFLTAFQATGGIGTAAGIASQEGDWVVKGIKKAGKGVLKFLDEL